MRLASLIGPTEAAQVAGEDIDVVWFGSKDMEGGCLGRTWNCEKGRRIQLEHPNICVFHQIKIKIKMVTGTAISLQLRVEVAQLNYLI